MSHQLGQYRAQVQQLLEAEKTRVAKRMLGGVEDRVYASLVGEARAIDTALGLLQVAEDQLFGRTPQPEQPTVNY